LETDLGARLAPYAKYVTHVRAKSDGRKRLYVGRGDGERGRYGNRHEIRDHSEAERLRVVEANYRDWEAMDPTERETLLAPVREHLEASGVLACFCFPKLCHGQVIAAFALSRRMPDLDGSAGD
jgi:hypothetical protein